jgi:Flp pilus assembly protein TadB
MSQQDGRDRDAAARVWLERQRLGAVEHDRERAREQWRDAIQERQQRGPIVGVACFVIAIVGITLLARYGAIVWIVAAALLIAAIALAMMWKRRSSQRSSAGRICSASMTRCAAKRLRGLYQNPGTRCCGSETDVLRGGMRRSHLAT